MSHQLTREEAKDVLRQNILTDAPEDDAFAGWPLHKIIMWVYRECGPDSVTVLLEQFDLRYEALVDNAQELQRRHFPQVAAPLSKAAETARSEIDDIIEQPEYVQYLGPDAVENRKQQRLVYWIIQRMKITGQSWNTLRQHYGLEEWFGPKDRDYTLDADNRVRHLPAMNGAATGQ